MTVRYVGIGGNDGANGLSWANRKLTLNGAENTPVAGDDIVYVGPGTYRELLTCDVSGTAGHTITYIGDVDGSHTDGIGGIVRATGSDNDTTATRASCFLIAARNYRTFQGFTTDLVSTASYDITTGTNAIIQDCFGDSLAAAVNHVRIVGTGSTTCTIQRNAFIGGYGIYFQHSSAVDAVAHLVQNNLFLGCTYGIRIDRIGGLTIKNNTFIGNANAIRCPYSPNAGQVNNANNNIIYGGTIGFQGAAAGDITSDYNSLFGCTTPYTTIAAGAHDNAYPPLFNPMMLLSGYKYPWSHFSLSSYSTLRAIAGTGEATDDLFGRARPATAAKNSWGAVQFSDTSREVTTVHAGAASIKFEDAGKHQIFVPVTSGLTKFTVYCYREADYAGTNPQMIIKVPGMNDIIATDAGAASSWNQLEATLDLVATPPYAVVELVSNNTNTANAATNDCFFDDLVVATGASSSSTSTSSSTTSSSTSSSTTTSSSSTSSSTTTSSSSTQI